MRGRGAEKRPARDTQRSAVYAWERGLPGWPGPALRLADCQEVVSTVWGSHADGPAPRVADGRGRRHAAFDPVAHAIRLPRWSRGLMVVLHETAHAILWQADRGLAWHGPEFTRLYLTLLYLHAGVDIGRARALASAQRPRRVRFARLADVPGLRERVVDAGVRGPAGDLLLF